MLQGLAQHLTLRLNHLCVQTGSCASPDSCAAVQEERDGYLRPMRSHDWDKGSLLSMRTMNFAGSFPYESIAVPVRIIIGEDDTFLLKTAKRVGTWLWPCTPSGRVICAT